MNKKIRGVIAAVMAFQFVFAVPLLSDSTGRLFSDFTESEMTQVNAATVTLDFDVTKLKTQISAAAQKGVTKFAVNSSIPSNAAAVNVSLGSGKTVASYISGDTIYIAPYTKGKAILSPDLSSLFTSSPLEEITISGFDMSYVKCLCFSGSTKLKKCTIRGVINTGNISDINSLFNRCTSLESVTLDLDLSGAHEVNHMFAFCENLTEINLGSKFKALSPTSMVEMFILCKSLKSVDFSGMISSDKIERFTHVFMGCNSLETVEFGDNLGLNGVKDLSSLFSGCSELKEIDFGSKFNTENVETMNGMFNGCQKLKSIKTGSGFDTSSVTDMNGMFYNCSSLTSIDLGEKFDTSNVTNMKNMFNTCSSLSFINLGDKFNTSNVTNMSGIFNSCQSLESICCPEESYNRIISEINVTKKPKLHNYNLTDIIEENIVSPPTCSENAGYLPACDVCGKVSENIYYLDDTKIPHTDDDKDSLCDVCNQKFIVIEEEPEDIQARNGEDVPFRIKASGSGLRYLWYYSDNGKNWGLANYNNESSEEFIKHISTTSYSGEHYYYCLLVDDENNTLKSKTAKITVDGLDEKAVVFDRYKLKDAVADAAENGVTGFAVSGSIPENAEVTYVNSDRTVCVYTDGDNEEKTLYIAAADPENTIFSPENSSALFKDSSFDHIDLSGINFSTATDMSSLFSSSQNLKSITFGDTFNTENVTDMSYMFNQCRNLGSLEFNENFKLCSVKNMNYMFYGSSLTEIDLSRFDNSVVTRMAYMFQYCDKLETVKFSDSFDTHNVRDVLSMFDGCSSLKYVDLGKSFIIDENYNSHSSAFWNCDNLETVCCPSDTFRFLKEDYDFFHNYDVKNHSFDLYEKNETSLIRKATCYEDAEYGLTCSLCGEVSKTETFTDDGSQLSHDDSDKNGLCDLCSGPINGMDTFLGVHAVINGEISMVFSVALSPEAVAAGPEMVFYLDSDRTVTVPFSEARNKTEGVYEFTLPLTATQMDVNITAEIRYSEEISYNPGTCASVLENYSVNRYLNSLQEREEEKEVSVQNTRLLDLVKAMKNYGAYMDIYSGDMTSDVSADNMDDINPVIDDRYKAVITGNADGLKAKSATLKIGSLIDLTVKFSAEDPEAEYQFTVDNGNGSGGMAADAVYINGVYSVTVHGLSPLDYGKIFTISASDGENTLSVQYSALTYVKSMLYKTDDVSLVNVCKAIYLYGKAASEYSYQAD